MKIKYMVAGILAVSAVFAQAKRFDIPKNAAQDTDKIMSQKYWDIWRTSGTRTCRRKSTPTSRRTARRTPS